MHNDTDLDSVIEQKLNDNLKWSMLFFVFNFIAASIDKKKNSEHTDNTFAEHNTASKFFKHWKKHATENMVKKDLEIINSILNSPRNIFHSILKNNDDPIESTEIYQEKYNLMFKNIEDFFKKNTKDSDKD